MYRSERDCIKHLGSRLFMFRTWIIRQHNTVWVHKLTDIVTSLDSKLVSYPKSDSMWHVYLDLLNNIIIGINELHVCKYLLDLDLTLMNIWRDNYCLENDYDSKTKLSIISKSYNNESIACLFSTRRFLILLDLSSTQEEG